MLNHTDQPHNDHKTKQAINQLRSRYYHKKATIKALIRLDLAPPKPTRIIKPKSQHHLDQNHLHLPIINTKPNKYALQKQQKLQIIKSKNTDQSQLDSSVNQSPSCQKKDPFKCKNYRSRSLDNKLKPYANLKQYDLSNYDR